MHSHHKVPKHMGSSDDPSNIESVTIPEHAERHRILFETHGHWQDKLAWQGLSKQITKEEITKQLQCAPKSEEWKQGMSERMKGVGNHRYGKPGTMLGKKMPQSAKDTLRQQHLGKTFKARQWEIITPTGNKEIITNLSSYCRDNKLAQSSMILVSQGLRTQHKGYSCKKMLQPHINKCIM